MNRPSGVPSDTVPNIRHSQKFILVDRYGMVRGFYDSDEDGLEALRIDALVIASIDDDSGPLARR